jgi:hypothetical protein
MRLFRRLTADVPGELLAAQIAATNPTSETAAEATAVPADWEPAPEYPEIWAALAAASVNVAMIHATHMPFMPAQPKEHAMSKYRDSLTPGQRADLNKLTALRESGYTGWVGEHGEPATKENTDPRVWEAIQTPFRQPRKSN